MVKILFLENYKFYENYIHKQFDFLRQNLEESYEPKREGRFLGALYPFWETHLRF